MSIWDKIKDIMVIPDEDDYDEEAPKEVERPSREKAIDDVSYTPKKEAPARLIKSKTVNYTGGNSGMQVVLVKPNHFEEVKSIVDYLNEGKTVVLNLEETPTDVQRRIVDFLSGAAYAIGGNMRKVAKCTFMVASRGVDVMGELMADDYDEGKIYF
ncbi:MAG: cell division protein SepF [Ruminococcaceae bacterium]|nr:cell division protein SepF [Oscillospiraceae bacterium]